MRTAKQMKDSVAPPNTLDIALFTEKQPWQLLIEDCPTDLFAECRVRVDD